MQHVFHICIDWGGCGNENSKDINKYCNNFSMQSCSLKLYILQVDYNSNRVILLVSLVEIVS